MVKLSEAMVLGKTRATELEYVRKLNCWASDLTDVSVVRQMPNVQVLSLSLNNIETLEDFSYCPCLEELYIRKNLVRDLSEVRHLERLPNLRNLWLAENPCADAADYRSSVIRCLPNLQKLDNIVVEDSERLLANTLSSNTPQDVASIPATEDIKQLSDTPVFTEVKNIVETSSFNPNTSQISDIDLLEIPSLASSGSKNISPVSTTEVPRPLSMHRDECSPSFMERTPCTASEDRSRVVVSWDAQTWCTCKDNLGDRGDPGTGYTFKHSNQEQVTSSAVSRPNFRRYTDAFTTDVAMVAPPYQQPRQTNANVLQAVLCLVNELDITGLEIVADAVRNRRDALNESALRDLNEEEESRRLSPRQHHHIHLDE